MRRILLLSLPVTAGIALLLAWWISPWALLLLLLPLDLMLWATLRPRSQWWGTQLSSFGSRYREVLITFDGAPDADETPECLVLLERYGASALFFVDALRARQHPELIREITARGHGLGCALTATDALRAWHMGPKALEAAIEESLAAIHEVLPGYVVQWYRSPAPLVLPWLHPILERRGLKLMGCSATDGGIRLADMEAALRRMRSDIGKGGVIQFHHNQRDSQGHGTLPEMLEEMLLWLRGQGYGMS